MTTLKLTMMLGPRETIEAGEAAMPEMAHCLFAADVLDGWDAQEVERVLMAAGGVFREAIMQRRHEEPPPPPRPLPVEVEQAIEATPPPTALVAIEAGSPLLGLRVEVARALEPEAWAAIDDSLRKADEVLAVVERRRAA